MTVPPKMNEVIIGDLLPFVSYSVTVAATTSVGTGEFSSQVTARSKFAKVS